MVDGTLVQALDWRKRKGEKYTRYSYREGDQWCVVKSGPGYHNLYQVTRYDEEGLRLLQSMERKEVSGGQDGTVRP